MIIKVCGMRDAENIREVAALGVDMMGFVFWPESPRFVRMVSSQAGIIPDYSEERFRQAHAASAASGPESPGPEVQDSNLKPQGSKFQVPSSKAPAPARVGVFVDEMPQTTVTRVYNYKLDYVQLHGEESRVMIENLRSTLVPDIAPGIKIIKALGVGSREDVARARDYEGAVDLFLFDTHGPTQGGSGRQFDWSVLDAYDGNTPFLLSGGIGPDDAARIRAFRHPQFAGVDLNSRFETEPGLKDVERLRAFIWAIQNS